jgi:hypothetical protein
LSLELWRVINWSSLSFNPNAINLLEKNQDKVDWSDIIQMETNKLINVLKSRDEVILDAKVKFWQENSDKMLTINSFNKDKWETFILL